MTLVQNWQIHPQAQQDSDHVYVHMIMDSLTPKSTHARHVTVHTD